MRTLNSPEPWIIVIDGLDKSGKTTIRDMLLKKLGRTHDVIDRWLLSDVAYNMLFERKPINWYDKQIELLRNYDRHLIVYIKADLSDASKLPELDLDDDIEADYFENRKKHEEAFLKSYAYLDDNGMNVVMIKNDYIQTLEEITDKIYNYICYNEEALSSGE